jgi:hypothetical protein
MNHLSRFVAGDEKFWILVLGAFQAFVLEGPYVQDPAVQALIVSLLIAGQGWLGTNTEPKEPTL